MSARYGNAQTPTQGTTGTIAGVAVDSVHGGYLRDAVVSVNATSRITATDSLGRFYFDSVPAGLRRLRITHPLLDTLGLSVSTPERELRGGEALFFVTGIPSPATIIRAKCPADQREKGAGAILGTVTDADTETPSSGSEVVVAWTDYAIGKKNIVKTPQRRTGKVRVDGTYIVCGVPNDLATGVYAVRGADTTAAVTIGFDRMLSIQAFYLPTVIESSPTAPDSANKPSVKKGGTAVLTGTVLDPSGKPLTGARISIEADEIATISGVGGGFTLRGARSGTRLLTVRKLGLEPVEVPTNLSALRPTSVVVQFRTSVQTLESVKVSALRDIGLQRVGFAERQRTGNGKYYSPADIERRNPLKLNYLLESAPMLRTGVTDDGKRYINGRGFLPCLRYYIDGTLTAEYGPGELEMLPDSYLSTAEIGAVEVYDKLSAPGEFFAISRTGQVCSVVVIWTKSKLGVR